MAEHISYLDDIDGFYQRDPESHANVIQLTDLHSGLWSEREHHGFGIEQRYTSHVAAKRLAFREFGWTSLSRV
jgi:hypothetical protein